MDKNEKKDKIIDYAYNLFNCDDVWFSFNISKHFNKKYSDGFNRCGIINCRYMGINSHNKISLSKTLFQQLCPSFFFSKTFINLPKN